MAKKYKINSELSGVTDTESGMSIPLVSGNRHYAEFVEWIDAGNTPDNSISVQDFTEAKVAQIKAQFESSSIAGYTVSSGMKYDATLMDYVLLSGARDFAVATGLTEMKVRDYNNKVHTLSIAQMGIDIIEIAGAYKVGMEAKWAAQENAGNEGYSQYAQGELIQLASIIEGNR